MIKKLNLEDEKVLERILELQKASYVIEADLIGFYDIPPLKDTLETLKNCSETFYGYYVDDILAGIISYKIDVNTLDIHRVAVHSDFFRRGIAKQMLCFMEKVEKDIDKIIVSTGAKNYPAVKLYLDQGFKKLQDIEVEKGIFITSFEKNL